MKDYRLWLLIIAHTLVRVFLIIVIHNSLVHYGLRNDIAWWVPILVFAGRELEALMRGKENK